MTEPDRRRPVGVGVVAALTWIVAFFDVVVGAALLLIAYNPSLLDQVGAAKVDVRNLGLALALIGLLTALVAIGIAKGSNGSRVLVIVLMAMRIAAAAYGLVAIQDFTVWTGAVEVAFAIVIVAMLSTRRASDFFRKR